MEILVGIDGSPHADRALAWALREAALRSARLRVLNAFRVHEFAGAFGREVSLDKERGEAEEMVAQALARVTSGGTAADEVEVDTAAVTGRGAADAILRHRGEAELIVVGSRGLGGFPGLLLGSVSHQVASHADVPVAVIPATVVSRSDSDGTRAIVVGVDGSAASVHALRWALDEAKLRNVGVTAVYAYRGLRDGAPFDAFASIEQAQLDDLQRHANETALRKLATLIEEAGGTSGVEVGRRVESGSPAKVLTADAADERTIVVVGSRGRGGFTGLLLGSVSQQCLHHARGPVVVTPAVD